MTLRHCIMCKCSYAHLENKQAFIPSVEHELFDSPGDANSVYVISEMLETSLFEGKSFARSTNAATDKNLPFSWIAPMLNRTILHA